MSEGISKPLPQRQEYSVKVLLNDLKKIEPTPGVIYRVGPEIVYYEWTLCSTNLGQDHPVTRGLAMILDFVQHGYEELLVRGDIHKSRDTPLSAINELTKSVPAETLDHVFSRSGDYIRSVLELVRTDRARELEKYSQIESGVRQELERSPNDPSAYNKLRILLWILGRHKEAADAFQSARRLGWTSSNSDLVAV
jgi:hypothetical protein